MHLVDLCIKKGVDVFGIDLRKPETEFPKSSSFRFMQCDLRDAKRLMRVLKEVRADKIFHLAGVNKGSCLHDFLDVNLYGTLNLFEVIKGLSDRPMVLITGSSAEYGLGATDSLISETTPFRPFTDYGLSKLFQEFVSLRYYLTEGIHVVRSRAFNITGPGEPPWLVCSSFAKQVAEIEAGILPPILKVGNLESYRDFLDVRDVVRGYWILLEHGMPGEVYNLCSGVSRKISDVLQTILDISGVKVRVEVEDGRFQRGDVSFQCGSFEKVKSLGWKPEIEFLRSMQDLLNFWRFKIRS
jgi:GDP-4-dehydro-6-deoxy-D-mannose reductase